MTEHLTPPEQSKPQRLEALDLLRVCAFGLLILFHCGMYYVSWDWHVKSPRVVTSLEPVMHLSSPWRMALLFVISGAVLALIAQRAPNSGKLAWRRTQVLMAPLLMGLFITVLPQAYMEAREKLQYAGSLWEFALRYWAADTSFCDSKGCMPLPTWNHLWFLPYVWTYSLVLLGLVYLGAFARLQAAGGWLSRGPQLLWLPVLWFALVRNTLFVHFPSTHDWTHDAYNHALYASAFFLGAIILGQREQAQRDALWARVHRLRWWTLSGAMVAMLLHFGVNSVWKPQALPEWALAAMRANTGFRQWLPIVAALGFAHGFCMRRAALPPSALLRYLSGMVFCAYVLHQTVLVVLAPNLALLKLPLPMEAGLLVVLTFCASWMGFDVLRRAGVLGVWFGIRR